MLTCVSRPIKGVSNLLSNSCHFPCSLYKATNHDMLLHIVTSPNPFQPTPPPKHPHPPSTPPLHFVDAPYTEWMSQRWTHFGDNFSDWPSLPPFINGIQQISSGKLGGEQGVWFLTDDSLYFALNLDGGDPGRVQFVDISDGLDMGLATGSQIAVDLNQLVYVATPYNVTLLNCSQDPKFT